MKLPVLGMDPSLRNWGLASGLLDLQTGCLELQRLDLIQPQDLKGKQVRVNSNDLHLARQLAEGIAPHVHAAKAIFVEVPVGSQSSRAMASYGVCVGVLGSLLGSGSQLIEVTATEVKLVLTSNKLASKEEMIARAYQLYPNANWPLFKGKPSGKSEHLADAVGTIHAGVRTPVFQNLMQLLKTARTHTQ